MDKKTIENYGTPLNLGEAENYLFCGALSKTMQRVGRPDFDYWFCSGITGDTFTQVFSRHFDKYYDCLSSAIFGKAHLDNIFSAMGYGYTLVDNAAFYQAPAMYIAKIKTWIDNDVPVIVKDTADSWYSMAVGYEGDTILKFDMLGEGLQPYTFNLGEDTNCALVFVEEMTREIEMAAAYRNAVLAVPGLLNKPSTHETSFGKQAFTDWANSLEAGRGEFLGDYFDWAATNAHMDTVLARALALNGDLQPLVEKLSTFGEMNSRLFNHSHEAQQAVATGDNEKLAEIAAKIRALANYCDVIIDASQK
jgi:hypothetical protein